MYSSFSLGKHEMGQGLVEYALILVLVALVVIAALMILGPVIGNVFSQINSSLSRVGAGGSTEGGGEETTTCTTEHQQACAAQGLICIGNGSGVDVCVHP